MKPENQIDLIAAGLGKGSAIAAYGSMDSLLVFVEAALRGKGHPSMANLIVAMTIAPCKNLIDEKLQGEQHEETKH